MKSILIYNQYNKRDYTYRTALSTSLYGTIYINNSVAVRLSSLP